MRKDETADEAVAVGGSVEVEGEVSDGVTAIGGPARIEGRVGGDVVSVGGSVYLGPRAVVNGDVTSVGGIGPAEPGRRQSTAPPPKSACSRSCAIGEVPDRSDLGPALGATGAASPDLMGSLVGLVLMRPARLPGPAGGAPAAGAGGPPARGAALAVGGRGARGLHLLLAAGAAW